MDENKFQKARNYPGRGVFPGQHQGLFARLFTKITPPIMTQINTASPATQEPTIMYTL